jgi:hypothetical protein
MIPQKLKLISLMPLAVVCFALAPPAGAAGLSPAPDGGYPGGTTAEGDFALAILTTGAHNTALGFAALNGTTTGGDNTAIGNGALFAGGNGGFNVATGVGALLNNTNAFNSADGYNALFSNTGGQGNTGTGFAALNGNSAGSGNTGSGFGALFASTGSGNTAIGTLAGAGVITANGVTCLGAGAFGQNATNTTWIANVYATPTISATFQPVQVSNTGQLGAPTSSIRFKHDVKPMDKTSEALLALKPVTFHYKNDSTNTAQFGLIAEEVAKVNPDLIVRDNKGEIFSVRYDAVNAMLLNEFLKQHRMVEEQAATIAQLKSGMDALVATVKEQASQIQKVSAQVELSKPAPQTVANK